MDSTEVKALSMWASQSKRNYKSLLGDCRGMQAEHLQGLRKRIILSFAKEMKMST